MARSVSLPINPLSPEHHDVITQTLRSKEHMPESFQIARSCGINCDEMEQAYHQSKAGLEKILATYFPKGRNSGPADAG